MKRRRHFGGHKAKKTKVPKSVKSYVKKEIVKEFEIKQITSSGTGAAVVNSGLVENASYPVSIANNPGVNRSARIGNKIKIVEYKVMIDYFNISTDAPMVVRHIMVYDKACKGQTAAQFLVESDANQNSLFDAVTATAANGPLWMFNADHVGKGSDHRFEILHDKTFAINPFSSTQAIHKIETVHKKWKNGKKVVFDDLNPLVAGPTAVTSGIIWHVFLNDAAVGFLDLNIVFDIRFIDAD